MKMYAEHLRTVSRLCANIQWYMFYSHIKQFVNKSPINIIKCITTFAKTDFEVKCVGLGDNLS